MSDMKEALKVYDKIKTVVNTDDQDCFSVYPYHNGRENGLAIIKRDINNNCNNNTVVIFSEYRRSDDIVVYHEKISNFSNFFAKIDKDGFPLSEEAYNKASFFNIYDNLLSTRFKSSKYVRAANFIKKLLTETAVK
jgi:hypothetical protein